jgi:putative NADPH-quinone reductase
MTPKKIVIICGHPNNNSFTGAILDNYEMSARTAGHDVVRFNLSELSFDPILHNGYHEIQPLESDLIKIQDAVRDCEHLVIGYPNWWTSMPALLKGMFDRLWLPGFAFNFDKTTGKAIQHLKGKTARVFVLSGSNSPFKTWWNYGDYTNEIQFGILEFAGIKTRVSTYGPCEKVSDANRQKWLEDSAALGKAAK